MRIPPLPENPDQSSAASRRETGFVDEQAVAVIMRGPSVASFAAPGIEFSADDFAGWNFPEPEISRPAVFSAGNSFAPSLATARKSANRIRRQRPAWYASLAGACTAALAAGSMVFISQREPEKPAPETRSPQQSSLPQIHPPAAPLLEMKISAVSSNPRAD